MREFVTSVFGISKDCITCAAAVSNNVAPAIDMFFSIIICRRAEPSAFVLFSDLKLGSSPVMAGWALVDRGPRLFSNESDWKLMLMELFFHSINYVKANRQVYTSPDESHFGAVNCVDTRAEEARADHFVGMGQGIEIHEILYD